MTTLKQDPPLDPPTSSGSPADDESPDNDESPDPDKSAAKPDSAPPAATPDVASAGRPRLVEAVVETARGWNSGVKVTIARGSASATGEREAVGEEAVVLRSVADATLDALTMLLGGERRFALVGAKRMLAFDSAVLLVCIRTLVGPSKKLIGCVPIQDDPVTCVARAVLHAANRILEGLPNAGE